MISTLEPTALPFTAKVHLEDLRRMEAQMMAFPHYEVADPEAADAFVQGRIQISLAIAMLDDLPRGEACDAASIVVTVDMLRQIIEQTAEIERAVVARLDH